MSSSGVSVSHLRETGLLGRVEGEFRKWIGAMDEANVGEKEGQVPRERQSISAQHYMILRGEDDEDAKTSRKG